MGLTHIQACIANPARPRRSARLKFLLDSGALYSVVPTPVLRRLGIKPGKSKTFILADGTEIKRSLGQALFRMNGEEGASPMDRLISVPSARMKLLVLPGLMPKRRSTAIGTRE